MGINSCCAGIKERDRKLGRIKMKLTAEALLIKEYASGEGHVTSRNGDDAWKFGGRLTHTQLTYYVNLPIYQMWYDSKNWDGGDGSLNNTKVR